MRKYIITKLFMIDSKFKTGTGQLQLFSVFYQIKQARLLVTINSVESSLRQSLYTLV